MRTKTRGDRNSSARLPSCPSPGTPGCSRTSRSTLRPTSPSPRWSAASTRVRRIRSHGIAEGPWELREEWLNEQIARTWVDRGAFPGLGAALEALGMRLGMALALELVAGGQVAANADPWPFVDALLRGEADPPQRAYAADIQEVRATWAKLTDERRALLQLLSRFALSPAQARRWFEVARRNAATTETLSDREILDNPYRIAEGDLGTLEAARCLRRHGGPGTASRPDRRGELPGSRAVACR